MDKAIRPGNFRTTRPVYRLGAVNPDDSQLIASSVRGDRVAFGELVCRYQDRLYHTVYRLIGNADDAQDVVQDSFLNAYQSLHQFKGDARFFTWLYRIAVNAAISLKRKHRALLTSDLRSHGRWCGAARRVGIEPARDGHGAARRTSAACRPPSTH